jgi:hypothetical protein
MGYPTRKPARAEALHLQLYFTGLKRVLKSSNIQKNRPSAAKAALNFVILMARLKPCPFKDPTFSASSEARCFYL